MTNAHLYVNRYNLLWIVESALFIVYSARALSLFIPSLHRARALKFNGRRKRIAVDLAKDYVIGETIRMIQHVLSLYVGIESVFIAPDTQTRLDRIHALFSFQVIIAILFLNALTGVNSMRAVRSWNRRDGIIRGKEAETILARLEARTRRSALKNAEQDVRLDVLEGDAAQTRESSTLPGKD
jgi:hypothetical protein